MQQWSARGGGGGGGVHGSRVSEREKDCHVRLRTEAGCSLDNQSLPLQTPYWSQTKSLAVPDCLQNRKTEHAVDGGGGVGGVVVCPCLPLVERGAASINTPSLPERPQCWETAGQGRPGHCRLSHGRTRPAHLSHLSPLRLKVRQSDQPAGGDNTDKYWEN